MASNLENDTIAAIATAPGNGAVGIVRVSGPEAVALLRGVFVLPGNKTWEATSHTMYYGHIVDNGETIDEVMVCPMLAPRSYTMEDTVEIYAHGGTVVLNSVLHAVINKGARLANPGEFTKRAFLNGRINLTQAEAVMDIISAGSDQARRAGLKQLGGGLSHRIEAVRNTILSWLAHIELSIDYPEHEDEAKTLAQILVEGVDILSALRSLLDTATIGRMISQGIKTAIIGRPNAGKSTLLNAILSEDRAIVHEAAGTTRDVLTEHVVVKGVPLLLMDTAGIRETADPVEKIGVEKSLEAAGEAELVLYIIDGSQPLEDHLSINGLPFIKDKAFINGNQFINGKPLIVLINKCDLPRDDSTKDLTGIEISTRTGEGLDTLYQEIHHTFLKGIDRDESHIITRERHRILLAQAINHLETGFEEIRQGVPEDLVSIHLRSGYMALGEILGVAVADDIVDRIFAEFCLGK